ncbi:hypothetical protein BDF20DRAFT_831130 [Mycotypha africana]|uniref:uncharacterized protein n=1 Tax=Mycotypha africana TaxID=64632 RepID=UPI002300BBC6|nr:uncharacterized protein BDF20DRAFT_831130 [Mycotypha africana]KAI8991046.1 hypothetical protein BDF20DRAFT_831130 [Mycotypha africana]
MEAALLPEAGATEDEEAVVLLRLLEQQEEEEEEKGAMFEQVLRYYSNGLKQAGVGCVETDGCRWKSSTQAVLLDRQKFAHLNYFGQSVFFPFFFHGGEEWSTQKYPIVACVTHVQKHLYASESFYVNLVVLHLSLMGNAPLPSNNQNTHANA